MDILFYCGFEPQILKWMHNELSIFIQEETEGSEKPGHCSQVKTVQKSMSACVFIVVILHTIYIEIG